MGLVTGSLNSPANPCGLELLLKRAVYLADDGTVCRSKMRRTAPLPKKSAFAGCSVGKRLQMAILFGRNLAPRDQIGIRQLSPTPAAVTRSIRKPQARAGGCSGMIPGLAPGLLGRVCRPPGETVCCAEHLCHRWFFRGQFNAPHLDFRRFPHRESRLFGQILFFPNLHPLN